MNTDITTIEDAGILNTENINAIRAVSQSIQEGFDRRQRFRPRFLMETAVLNDMKHPTPDAKYWQSTVERDVHFKNLLMLSFDYREKQADIDLLELEVDVICGDLTLREPERRKKQIQIERERVLLLYMAKEAQERVREITSWSEIMEELEPQLKYDPEDIEAHMPEAYAIRYAIENEVMQLVEGQSDMNGAMNIISVGKSIGQHKAVQDLIE